jgi:hypothetical protein
VLCQETSHHDFTVFLGSSILAITAVELFGHPFRKGPFVSLDGCQLLGVPAQVVGQRVGQRGGERLTPLEPFCREAERCSLEASVAG